MKFLNGAELAGFIKERQAHQVRGLRQAHQVEPKLVILQTVDDLATATYLRLKQAYGADIGIDVEIIKTKVEDIAGIIAELNNDTTVHGIVIQLPLSDKTRTEEICNLVAPHKDVDGLAGISFFDPATPQAIVWLLAGYNVSLEGKQIVIIGKGKLVGAPLATMLQNSNLDPFVIDSKTSNPAEIIKSADILICASGVPGLIKSEDIKSGVVIVDAATADDNGVLRGDVDDSVYEREDITITPQKGGVGPLTVASLFDNVIKAAQQSIVQDEAK